MDNMTLFATMTAEVYKQSTAKYTGEGASYDYQHYCDYLANCVFMAMTSQDSTHLNKLVEASKYRNMYRIIKPFADSISPFKWSKSKGYHGKMNKAIMAQIKNVDDDGVYSWERKLHDMLGKVSEKQAERDTKDTTFDAEKRFDSFFKACGNNGMTLEQMRNMFESKFAEYSESMLDKAA